jgi:hypothetical protein
MWENCSDYDPEIEKQLGGAQMPKVVAFKAMSGPPVKRSKPGTCRHTYVDLDRESKTVECESCHKTVDPFWFLEQLAQK